MNLVTQDAPTWRPYDNTFHALNNLNSAIRKRIGKEHGKIEKVVEDKLVAAVDRLVAKWMKERAEELVEEAFRELK